MAQSLVAMQPANVLIIWVEAQGIHSMAAYLKVIECLQKGQKKILTEREKLLYNLSLYPFKVIAWKKKL